MKYNVHIYAIVRVKALDVEAFHEPDFERLNRAGRRG